MARYPLPRGAKPVWGAGPHGTKLIGHVAPLSPGQGNDGFSAHTMGFRVDGFDTEDEATEHVRRENRMGAPEVP